MLSFKDSHKKFINNLKKQGKASATIVAYSKDIEQLLDHVERLGKGLIHEISKEDLEHFLESLRKSNYTPKSISRKINAMRTFFRFLVGEGIIKEDPAREISHPKIDQKKPRILSKTEYRALRDAAKSDIRSSAIIEILLQTGIRISELANIRLSHIEFGKEAKQGKLTVPQVETKQGREIPLNASVQKAIQEYLKIRPQSKYDHLFVTKTGRPLLIRNIRATLDRLFKAAEIPNAKVNDLRHTFIVHHLRNGVNIVLLSKIAGHKRLSTTEKYMEFVDEKARKGKSLELGEL